MTKKRIVKDYDQIPDEVKMKLKQEYPHGFSENLIKFTNAHGKMVSALPFETDEIYYLIRMTVEEAIQIVEEDEDFDDFGMELKIPVDNDGIETEIESGIDPELDELKEEASYEEDYDDDDYDDDDYDEEEDAEDDDEY